MRFIYLFLFLVLLVGCATSKPLEPLEPLNLSQIQNLGAISLLGEKITVARFNTISASVGYEAVPTWNIDNYALNIIEDELSKNEQFNFLSIDYEYRDFKAIYKSTKFTPYSRYELLNVNDRLIEIRDKYGIDTLILIVKASRNVGDNVHVKGYATFDNSYLGINMFTKIYLFANIVILDLKSMKILRTYGAAESTELGKSFRNKPFSRYTAEDLSTLKKLTTKHLNQRSIPLLEIWDL